MKHIAAVFIWLIFAVPSQARIITVDDDGPADFNNIQTAIDDANNGDTVEVYPGTYIGDGNRDIDFLGKAITVRSTDPNDPNIVAATIIDCNGTEEEEHRGFLFNTWEEANSVLAGLTITNGYAENGASICCEVSRPTIANCIITGNTAEDDGGGLYCGLRCCSTGPPPPPPPPPPQPIPECNFPGPTITNCVISNNSARAGGGIYTEKINIKLANCTFTGNSAKDGGGGICFFRNYVPPPPPPPPPPSIDTEQSSLENLSGSTIPGPLITNCLFSDNSAGSVGGGLFTNEPHLILVNCIFTQNSASYGGGLHSSIINTLLINCVFIGNSAQHSGGGLQALESDLTLNNCTFTGNVSPDGKALACGSFPAKPSSVSFANCILHNGGDEIWNNDESTIDITYSLVQGGWWGQGNIDSDPLFVESGYWDANGLWIDGDYHLLPDSPCIDTGDPNYMPEQNETDLDGRPRVINSRIDMGAYEYGIAEIQAEVDFDPNTLNLWSKGRWITAFIWLPEDYNAADIDPNSVALENQIKPVRFWLTEDKQTSIAKFDREEIQGILDIGEVELKISGQLMDGTFFKAKDTITVINKGGGKPIKQHKSAR